MLAPLTVLLLLAPTVSLASPGGSLEALLDRVSHHKRDPKFVPSTGTRIGMRGNAAIEKEMMKKQKVKREEMEKRELMAAGSDGTRMAKKYKKRSGAKTGKKVGKRWVWATEIIQDSTPTEGLPAVGVNADLLTPSIDVATPTISVSAPLPTTTPVNVTSVLNTTLIVDGTLLNGTLLSNGTIDLTLSNGTVVSLVNETISVDGSTFVLSEGEDSVSGDEVLVEVSSTNGVDGDEVITLNATDVISINDEALASEGTEPSAIAAALVLKRDEGHARHGKRAFEGGLVKGHMKARHRDGEGRELHIRKEHNHEKKEHRHEKKEPSHGKKEHRHEKKWVWATTIIQDDSSTSGIPPPGVNADLLTPSINVATPDIASPAAPTTTAAPATTTHKQSQAEQRMHDRLGHKRENHEEEKRWVWDSVIIQDGDTAPSEPATPTVDLGANPYPYDQQATPAADADEAAATSDPAPVTVVDKEAELEERRAAHKAAVKAGAAKKRAHMAKLYKRYVS